MALSKTMEDAVKEKDLGKIYSSFYTIMLSDPSFSSGRFDQVLNEVKKYNIEGFLQPYNGTEFKGQEDWNQQYWDAVASELMDNFCLKRIEHLKDISRVLYPISDEQYDIVSNSSNIITEKKTNGIQKSYQESNSNMGMIIVIAGIVLAVAITMIVLLV